MQDPIYSMKKEMFRRRYSIRTIKTYVYCLNKFLEYCEKDTKKITKKDVREFIEKIMDKDYAGNTINIYFNALIFFVREVLRKNWIFRIRYSKTPKEIPAVLSQEEVKRLFDSIENKKHKLMISLMYSAGLRVSELVSLRVKDIDFKNNHGWVRHGKGNKDRLFILSRKLKNELMSFIDESEESKNSWLFPGLKNYHLSTRTIQQIIQKARRLAKIDKKIHPHTLRHSFATHLIKQGNDVLSVQSLLGHKSAETTMTYVHMASPKMISVKKSF